MASFDAFFSDLAENEGGFVDDPADPGGATNKGVTMATFQNCAKRYLDIEPTLDNLKALTDAQAGQIYKPLYWDKVHGDESRCRIWPTWCSISRSMRALTHPSCCRT